MGKKGDKMTADSSVEAEEVVKILQKIGDVTSKKMFGGFGIFESSKMFGIVDSKGHLFLKADGSTTAKFEKAGSEKHGRMPYYSVPAKIRTDTEKLLRWAKSSIDIAHR